MLICQILRLEKERQAQLAFIDKDLQYNLENFHLEDLSTLFKLQSKTTDEKEKLTNDQLSTPTKTFESFSLQLAIFPDSISTDTSKLQTQSEEMLTNTAYKSIGDTSSLVESPITETIGTSHKETSDTSSPILFGDRDDLSLETQSSIGHLDLDGYNTQESEEEKAPKTQKEPKKNKKRTKQRKKLQISSDDSEIDDTAPMPDYKSMSTETLKVGTIFTCW